MKSPSPEKPLDEEEQKIELVEVDKHSVPQTPAKQEEEKKEELVTEHSQSNQKKPRVPKTRELLQNAKKTKEPVEDDPVSPRYKADLYGKLEKRGLKFSSKVMVHNRAKMMAVFKKEQ